MDDLVRWLGAQLDEDERIARAATPGPWWVDSTIHTESINAGGGTTIIAGARWGDEASVFESDEDAAHIIAHDPARVLREVEAKRGVVALHHAELIEVTNADREDRSGYWCFECDGEPFPCHTLRLLASVYADREGYRPEWAPTA